MYLPIVLFLQYMHHAAVLVAILIFLLNKFDLMCLT